MRGTIRWRLHVPGEKSTEEEHADDPDAENAGVLEKDTTQCLESEDEEDERMRVENGAAHDATVYAHSVTHSSDVVWASEALVCEMEEVVPSALPVAAWKEAVVNADEQVNEDGQESEHPFAEASVDTPILEEMMKEQKQEKQERSEQDLKLACSRITQQYEEMICRTAAQESGEAGRDDVLLQANVEVGVSFGTVFQSLEHADAAVRRLGRGSCGKRKVLPNRP
eukprot:CAMPEP_0195601252 /NCGR_PEP_ID=MMETSP0815-20121206/4984_1 /TAXON_ID=97485 /ORGANISM="Prymnesium parvum, Strain Texoma1" /LENGTH=224 /DNA_ID=CAMNT_0040740777 /DNA_START=114 /DNA_END=789 /DNA_ORIENTATION=+